MPFRSLTTTFLAGLWLAHPLGAAPTVIDDQELLKSFEQSLSKLVGEADLPTADALAAKANKAVRETAKLKLAAPQVLSNPDYEHLSRSVYLIGTVYKCGKCDKWHQGGAATAWCLSEDGVMVTNAHVFQSAKGGVMGVADREGRCHPVTDLLGIDAASDVAVFRVRAKGLTPLRLGASAAVGEPVTIISHPSGHHFFRSTGEVARYARRAVDRRGTRVTWMNVTADYAKGSSGGPVFNTAGEVVGMVSNTVSLYTEPPRPDAAPKGHLQMVIKSCVPVDAIRKLIEPAGIQPRARDD